MIQANKIVTTWPDAEQLAHAVAHFIVLESRKALIKKDFFTLALSGGSTPELLYKLLATEPYKSNINWKKTVIAFGDERFVPRSSGESNYKMAYDALLSKVPVPKKQILGIRTAGVTPAEAARKYEAEIKTFVHGKNKFDVVLLGMGDDGHTASIFPGSDLLFDKKNKVRSVWVEAKKMDRISFTLPFINSASNVAFMVAGAAKAATLKQIFTGKNNELPAAKVAASHQLYWFLDAAAAALT